MQRASAESIERELSAALLRGDYPTNSRLPPLQQLAREFGVNTATVQRAIDRLCAAGLVTAKKGSGVTVNDQRESADLALLPARVEALLAEPSRAVKVLGDFLELRRLVVGQLLLRYRQRVVAHLPRLRELLDAVRTADTVDQLMVADLAFARALVAATGNTAALSVFNTFAKLLQRVPVVAAAMYAQPKSNQRALVALVALLEASGSDKSLAELVDSGIAQVDGQTMRRFERHLSQQD
ncbi:MAG: FadR family transcriptional regulator [Deltaproteobacteria bacterium]|nr:FadR family transcriptional regulator [Deltaproteobacteria bacterium]